MDSDFLLAEKPTDAPFRGCSKGCLVMYKAYSSNLVMLVGSIDVSILAESLPSLLSCSLHVSLPPPSFARKLNDGFSPSQLYGKRAPREPSGYLSLTLFATGYRHSHVPKYRLEVLLPSDSRTLRHHLHVDPRHSLHRYPRQHPFRGLLRQYRIL